MSRKLTEPAGFCICFFCLSVAVLLPGKTCFHWPNSVDDPLVQCKPYLLPLRLLANFFSWLLTVNEIIIILKSYCYLWQHPRVCCWNIALVCDISCVQHAVLSCSRLCSNLFLHRLQTVCKMLVIKQQCIVCNAHFVPVVMTDYWFCFIRYCVSFPYIFARDSALVCVYRRSSAASMINSLVIRRVATPIPWFNYVSQTVWQLCRGQSTKTRASCRQVIRSYGIKEGVCMMCFDSWIKTVM